MKKRAHLFIYGKVVGVGFRAWVFRQAYKLKLGGWVRNAGFNKVFTGEERKIEKMIELCRRGPEEAFVEKVKVNWEEGDDFLGFEIRY